MSFQRHLGVLRGIAILGMIGCFAGTARADDQPSAAYRAKISDAVDEFGLGNWQEAAILFGAAHELYPNARTHRGIGMTNFRLKFYPESIRHLEAALSSDTRPLTKRQRRDTRKLLAKGQALVGKLSVTAKPEFATLLVDGKQQNSHQVVVLNAGDHTMRVEAPGHEFFTRVIEVDAGKTLRLEISLEPREPKSPIGKSTNATPTINLVLGNGTGASQVTKRPALLPFAIMGGGVVVLGGAFVTGLMTASAESELKEAGCAVGCKDPAHESTRTRGEALQAVTNILLATGGAAVLAGTVWWLLDSATELDESPTVELSPAAFCIVGGCSAVLHGRF